MLSLGNFKSFHTNLHKLFFESKRIRNTWLTCICSAYETMFVAWFVYPSDILLNVGEGSSMGQGITHKVLKPVRITGSIHAIRFTFITFAGQVNCATFMCCLNFFENEFPTRIFQSSPPVKIGVNALGNKIQHILLLCCFHHDLSKSTVKIEKRWRTWDHPCSTKCTFGLANLDIEINNIFELSFVWSKSREGTVVKSKMAT